MSVSTTMQSDLLAPATTVTAAAWYAIYTRARHEKSVTRQMEERAIECFLPLYQSVRRWKDRRVHLDLPLFPGYLFVHTQPTDRVRVLQTPGVAHFVGVAGLPSPVPDDQISSLRSCIEQKLRMEPHPYLSVGGRVRVRTGPFSDLEGILIRKKKGYRLIISIHLIQRSVAVEVDACDVVPLR